jgi:hypothetical protein
VQKNLGAWDITVYSPVKSCRLGMLDIISANSVLLEASTDMQTITFSSSEFTSAQPKLKTGR